MDNVPNGEDNLLAEMLATADPELAELAKMYGYKPECTGGDLTGWVRKLPDGTYLRVCTEDGSFIGDVGAEIWDVSRDNNHARFCGIEETLPLRAAFEAAVLLPAPTAEIDFYELDLLLAMNGDDIDGIFY